MRKLLALFGLGCCVALGKPVQWNLSNVTFSDGGTASGFFIVNVDTSYPDFSWWNISTTEGSQLGAFDYTVQDSTLRVYNGSAIVFTSDATFPSVPNGPDENRILILGFSGGLGALTDAGGTVTLNANQPFSGTANGSGECLDCNPYRTVTGGSVIGGPVTFTTPEPSTVAMLPVGMLALWGIGRKLVARNPQPR